MVFTYEIVTLKVHFFSVYASFISTSYVCTFFNFLFKPPPPVGAGGGYMFSGRPSVPLSVRLCVRPSVIHLVVLCFRDISSIC